MDDVQVTGPGTAAATLSPDAEQLILAVLSQHADALLGTARRNSLCLDDAHDAYQRAMEIFTKRAARLTRQTAPAWLHTVVRNEAHAVRKTRLQLVGADEEQLDRQGAATVHTPEERAIGADRTARAAEALQRLKPDQLRAIWLRALGLSYEEIAAETGWTHTKVNRSLAEGRTTFLARFAGIESGAECARWAPVLSAIVDGEATSEQLLEVRPHTRNCPACRATLRELTEADSALRVIFPLGAVALVGRAASVLDRVLPLAAGSDAALAAGGLGSAAAAMTKVAALLAVGAASVTIASTRSEPPGDTSAAAASTAQPAPRHDEAITAVTPRLRRVAVTTTTAPTGTPTVKQRRAAVAAKEFVPPRAPEAPAPAPTPQSHEFTP